jgi:hypothetical protein|tara:strand:- start:399 stop:515 length:117 start_codon:yes stop_codon:yes gene_type:complete
MIFYAKSLKLDILTINPVFPSTKVSLQELEIAAMARTL